MICRMAHLDRTVLEVGRSGAVKDKHLGPQLRRPAFTRCAATGRLGFLA